MKNLSMYFMVLIILSCGVRDQAGIEDIIKQGNYSIACDYQGCFGGGTQILEVKSSDRAIYTNISGSRREERQVTWNAEKETLAREFFKTGISFHDTVGSCTQTSSYKLSGVTAVVEFDDLNCEMNEKFGALIE